MTGLWNTGKMENIVTRSSIRICALQISQQEKYLADGIAEFKASAGWCTRFMNRYGLSADENSTEAAKRPGRKNNIISKIHN